MKTRQRLMGFTLVELMITIAIIGILVGMAYPSYMNSVRKTNRVEAKAELMDAAQRLQRCYTAYASFINANCAVKTQLASTDGIISQGAGYYSIKFLGTPSATAYTLIAEPRILPASKKNPQFQDENCLKMTLSSLGEKSTEPKDKNCW